MQKLLLICTVGMMWAGSAWRGFAADAQTVIEQLKLVPMSDEACPGYFRETYRATRWQAKMEKERQAASLIYYLMTQAHREDPWHRLTSDEIMLYHAGAPMSILLLYTDGTWAEFTLGPRFDEGQVAQVTIPAGTWMGFVLRDDPDNDWGLYGVMVVPGWDLADVEFAAGPQVEPLRTKYPAAFQQVDARGWPVLAGE